MCDWALADRWVASDSSGNATSWRTEDLVRVAIRAAIASRRMADGGVPAVATYHCESGGRSRSRLGTATTNSRSLAAPRRNNLKGSSPSRRFIHHDVFARLVRGRVATRPHPVHEGAKAKASALVREIFEVTERVQLALTDHEGLNRGPI